MQISKRSAARRVFWERVKTIYTFFNKFIIAF